MYFQDGSLVCLMQEARLDVHSDLLKWCQYLLDKIKLQILEENLYLSVCSEVN